MKQQTLVLVGAAAFACTTFAIPAFAQVKKQPPGKWYASICRHNAQVNGFGSGVSYCARKAQEIKQKGKRQVIMD